MSFTRWSRRRTALAVAGVAVAAIAVPGLPAASQRPARARRPGGARAGTPPGWSGKVPAPPQADRRVSQRRWHGNVNTKYRRSCTRSRALRPGTPTA